MKSSNLLKILFFYFLVFKTCFGGNIEFESDNIKIYEEGKIIHAFNGKAFDIQKNLEIEGEKSIYDKFSSQLTIIKNVRFFDINKNILIESEKAIYYEKSNIIETYGSTYVKIEDKYEINSSNILYNRNKFEIKSSEDTTVKDSTLNVFNFEDGFRFEIDKEIISSKKTNVIDSFNNNYTFENAKINLINKEIIGKEVNIEFVDNLFGDEENDPKLKGKSIISNENFTKIYKSVFSTCNLENKKCRDWSMESEIFNHDKKKKIFEYKNSWVKMWDQRLMFIPYFNHPDPTVKRKSGFLTPSWTNSEKLGRWIHVPYFKVISKDKDMTFNPRFYIDDKIILQNEYRQALKNETEFISDFSVNHDGNNRSFHFFANMDGKLNDTSSYEMQFQNVTNDNYLKLYNLKLTSPIINNESTLTSYYKFKKEVEDENTNKMDYSLNLSTYLYENLGAKDSDKFQYVFPSFSYTKNIPIDESYNGNFTFNSSGFQKNYETNKYEMVANNDFLYESDYLISDGGYQSSYDINLRNINSYSENSSSYEEKNDHDIFGVMMFKTSMPLKREFENSTNFLKPLVSLKYSPNNTKDISESGTRVDYSSVFSLNRIGSSNTTEGGRSLTLGLEFEKQNLNNEKILGFNIANVIKDKKNKNLPKKSKLNQTRSDIIGELDYILNDTIDLRYKFSYDRDLHYSNYDSLASTIKVNNFITTFDYLTEHNDLDDKEVLTLKSSYDFNERSNINFKTRKDLDKDFTEYYNLIYTYKTDCLEANFEYNKKYYSDGNLQPDQSVFFTLRFIPFVEVRGKDTRLQDY